MQIKTSNAIASTLLCILAATFVTGCENKNGICLAGIVRDQFQGFGFWQMEQSFEEISGGPELLAAGL